MGAVVRLSGRLIRWFVICMQSLLPDVYQGRTSATGLGPEPEHLQGPWCRRVLQETFLAAMAEAACEAVTANQQLPGLMTQAVSHAKMCAIRGQ